MSRNTILRNILRERRHTKSRKSHICAIVSSNLSSSFLRYSERRSVLTIKKETVAMRIVSSVRKRERSIPRKFRIRKNVTDEAKLD